MSSDDVTQLGRRCPRCGKTLPQDAPEGLCAACLFAAGSETLTGGADAPTVVSAWADSAAGGDGQRLAAGQSWGPYRIGRLLGRGGMGEVYEAEHTETGRRIALKVLRSQLRNADDRARFLREGQLAASISHPHTVYIFGSEEIAGMPVISMELLPGGTLKDKLTAHGPFAMADAVSAVLDIIGGLDAAQSAGILHRDIKPSNCFIDSEGSVKVGDFGLSISTLARDVRHDFSTGFQGTPQFAAPEQLRGEPLDVRADIYAVGATLYYLLTGQAPFDAQDLRSLLARVTTEPSKSPRLVRPEIPVGLASVVLRCLAKTPADRPASYAALADALRPFSSRDDAPARPGLRVVAGMLDSLIVAVPAAVWVAWSGDPITGSTIGTGRLSAWTWLLNFAYYVFLEGLWGASLGKRLFGLRVTSADGAAASWLRIACRTAGFFSPNLLLALPLLTAFLNANSTVVIVRSIAALTLVAALFLTARRHNGWAAVHDLASGTRVVARATAGERRVGVPQDVAPVPAGATAAPARLRYGPFTAVSDAGDTGDGRLLVGFDPILRRPVWIHDVPRETPPTSAARRDVSRAGRLHWLTGRRSAGDNWDAFEAPDGGPFLARQGPAPGWPTLKLWLLDLAHELAAAARDGSAPGLGLDRIWLRNDGHVVLLDFAAPAFAGLLTSAAAPASAVDLTPVGLLSAVARRGMTMAVTTPAALPLSARALLDRWSSSTPPALDQARDALVEAAAAPDRVGRWRRAIPITLASGPPVLLIASALLVVPTLYGFLTQNVEMIGLLQSLAQPNPPPESRLADPEYRGAVERHLVGRYGAVLNDDGFWKSPIMQARGMRDLRRTAAEIMARRPSVSADELARASAIVASERARAEQRRPPRQGGFTEIGGIILGALAALSLLFVLGCSVVSSTIVPGGVVTRLLGLAVVTRDGTEISRWRSLVRVLVAWLPAIVWLTWLAASPKIQRFVPTRAASLPIAGLALGALAIGAIWTIARPARGPHDWLTGTWVAPR